MAEKSFHKESFTAAGWAKNEHYSFTGVGDEFFGGLFEPQEFGGELNELVVPQYYGKGRCLRSEPIYEHPLSLWQALPWREVRRWGCGCERRSC